jgi:hypothetical protein
MQFYEEIDGIMGTLRVSLADNGDGTERVSLRHTITPDLKPQDLPKGKYMPVRMAGIVFPTRIVEYVDVPKGRWVPDDVAESLVHKHVGANFTVEWLGRGWSIDIAYRPRRGI